MTFSIHRSHVIGRSSRVCAIYLGWTVKGSELEIWRPNFERPKSALHNNWAFLETGHPYTPNKIGSLFIALLLLKSPTAFYLTSQSKVKCVIGGYNESSNELLGHSFMSIWSCNSEWTREYSSVLQCSKEFGLLPTKGKKHETKNTLVSCNTSCVWTCPQQEFIHWAESQVIIWPCQVQSIGCNWVSRITKIRVRQTNL